jgi:hypothetical protein
MRGEINDFLSLIWCGREKGMDGGTVSVYGLVVFSFLLLLSPTNLIFFLNNSQWKRSQRGRVK